MPEFGEDNPTTPAIELVDSAVREWPDVKARKVFGHPGYLRGRKMFGWQEGEAFAVGKFGGEEANELEAIGIAQSEHDGAPMRGWYRIPVADDASASFALDWMRRAYEALG
jgi:hypothetical protein